MRLLNMPMIAVVGSRMASSGGLHHAAVFAQALSKAGALVVSGLAKGIDGAAHQAALDLGKNYFTLAVCGTGLDQTYPKEHIALAQKITRQGLIISELPLGVGPKTISFPKTQSPHCGFGDGGCGDRGGGKIRLIDYCQNCCRLGKGGFCPSWAHQQPNFRRMPQVNPTRCKTGL
jgi:hypothetical protein